MDPKISKQLMGLIEDLIFVFGYNRPGVHGEGAAKDAMLSGAKYGQGRGLQGRSYGITTKETWRDPGLPLPEIGQEIGNFWNFARARPQMPFLVTPIGTGKAGHSVEDIAKLFERLQFEENIVLPKQFREVLGVQPNPLTKELAQKLAASQ